MARLFRFSVLLLALALPLPGTAAQDPGVRVDRSVLDALGPPPRTPLGPGVEAAPSEPPRAARRAAPRRPAGEETKDGVVSVPPPPPIAAAPRREEEAPRPLAPSLLPPAVRAAQPQAAAPPAPPAAAPPAAAPPPAPAPPAPVPPPPPQPAPPAAAAAAPPPPAVPAAAPSPAPAATPVAASSRAVAPSLRLGFSGAATELDAASRQRVLGFASTLPDDDQVRVTVNAYASGDPSDPSRARRTSLSRALAVRAALMEGGIRSTRIDVRALGLAAGEGPPDRVDILAGTTR
jgi:outer membrane protein OmpA-like peptidoglycan-associated protein